MQLDKAAHYGLSAVIYAVMYALTDSWKCSFVVTISIGMTKEFVDAYWSQNYAISDSVLDLAADLAGICTMLFLIAKIT